MAENCNQDCGSCSSVCEEEQNPEISFEKLNDLSRVKKVIAIVSGKGGVGKSLVTGLMAKKTNDAGYNVAILDADITGPSIPKMFGLNQKAAGGETGIFPVTSKNGIDIMSLNLLLENPNDPVVWRGPIIAGAVKQFWSEVIWGEIDYMFVDMPPGTGDVPLTVFQSIPVDGIIVVTSPQDLVTMIVGKAVKMAKLMNIPIMGLVENMSYIKCPDCNKKFKIFGDSKVEQIAQEFNLKVLGKLPIASEIAKACDAGEIEDLEVDYLPDMVNELEKI